METIGHRTCWVFATDTDRARRIKTTTKHLSSTPNQQSRGTKLEPREERGKAGLPKPPTYPPTHTHTHNTQQIHTHKKLIFFFLIFFIFFYRKKSFFFLLFLPFFFFSSLLHFFNTPIFVFSWTKTPLLKTIPFVSGCFFVATNPVGGASGWVGAVSDIITNTFLKVLLQINLLFDFGKWTAYVQPTVTISYSSSMLLYVMFSV